MEFFKCLLYNNPNLLVLDKTYVGKIFYPNHNSIVSIIQEIFHSLFAVVYLDNGYIFNFIDYPCYPGQYFFL